MLTRRNMIAATIAVAATTRQASAQGVSRMTAYGFSFPALSGDDIKLSAFAGHPILVVNTASMCGFTPQFSGLQALWSEFHPRGLAVIGVPSNDFGSQEPGSPKEIADTAESHGVGFPMAAKTVVRGAGAHPFYKWAADARPRDVPRWNFHKYLVGADGYLADAFDSAVEPTDTRIKTAIARIITAA